MTTFSRILLTPRWAGTIESDWYPWLVEELGSPPIELVPLPEHSAPTIAGCVQEFGRALDAGDPATTLCVGHSVSVQGWLHTLADQPDRQVVGLLAVAGWWTVDEPWPTIEAWIAAEHDFTAIRSACPDIRVLLSDNDPFTRDHAANAEQWRHRLGATVTVVAGTKHFNAPTSPDVRDAILGWNRTI